MTLWRDGKSFQFYLFVIDKTLDRSFKKIVRQFRFMSLREPELQKKLLRISWKGADYSGVLSFFFLSDYKHNKKGHLEKTYRQEVRVLLY